MNRLLLLCCALLLSIATNGCTGHAHVHGGAHVHSAPVLVAVAPGVWVVEAHHEPVFYSSGYYWLYDGGVWYRSRHYTRAWVRVKTTSVPGPIVRIKRPRAYVHYHARAGARVKRGPKGAVTRRSGPPRRVETRDHRPGRADKRDHRRRGRGRR